MVSSTSTDLVEHRKALFDALHAQELMPVGMEHDAAKATGDVLDSSLQMVRNAAAYICVIGFKYGQVPEDAQRNPNCVSLTELEFDEAVRLGLPVLLFAMGDEHPVRRADVEHDPVKRKKLDAFRERAKQKGPESLVERVYTAFQNLGEFEVAANRAVSGLRRLIEKQHRPLTAAASDPELIPHAPALYAEPPYIGSHRFVGRQQQLRALSDWAAPDDPDPILLYEAIGGVGKSILTWEWTTNHAKSVRRDWAGLFWYSFYEKGSDMADFCRRAVAYMTGRPLTELRRRKTAELGDQVLRLLRGRPWLLVLDGLERVLVAFHRFDAAQVADDEAGSGDEIARRDPCAAIRPADDYLLRTFASAAPSKLLLTSRLVPLALLNSSRQPIPGVRHEKLSGLDPADAEALLRSCRVTGDSKGIQSFLKVHCDCHPLVTGVLAGLINNYLAARGDFDEWVSAENGGRALNLAKLDLKQKRNHILQTAIETLPEPGRRLLSTLALVSESVDYALLNALNPHIPPEPEKVKHPGDLADRVWKWMSPKRRKRAEEDYQADLERHRRYQVAVTERPKELEDAQRKLEETVLDLEHRGLLQYDAERRRYDLHPVVRAVASAGLPHEDRLVYGQRVVDHFVSQSHSAYGRAETIDDLSHGLHLVRTYLQIGRYQQAAEAFRGDLAHALTFNVEAHATILALLKPLFPRGWGSLPGEVQPDMAPYLANAAGNALFAMGEHDAAIAAYGAALNANLVIERWTGVRAQLSNLASVFRAQNRLTAASRHDTLALKLAEVLDDHEELFRARLNRFLDLGLFGRWHEAEDLWERLDPMGRSWNRATYRAGLAELYYAQFQFWRGTLERWHLGHAEDAARDGRDRGTARALHRLRGEWALLQRDWARAATGLEEAVRMAREIEGNDPVAEAQLALANVRLGRIADPRQEAQRLTDAPHRSDGDLAALWLVIGDRDQAAKHALAAYAWAWADGEPFVRYYDLKKARELLAELHVRPPDLPVSEQARDERFPWEHEVSLLVGRKAQRT